ncbi:hypothetical protein KM043_008687 [Ampulex compressa]|nr:hypothetical protein KM043_008687 [Ampulex compressa]
MFDRPDAQGIATVLLARAIHALGIDTLNEIDRLGSAFEAIRTSRCRGYSTIHSSILVPDLPGRASRFLGSSLHSTNLFRGNEETETPSLESRRVHGFIEPSPNLGRARGARNTGRPRRTAAGGRDRETRTSDSTLCGGKKNTSPIVKDRDEGGSSLASLDCCSEADGPGIADGFALSGSIDCPVSFDRVVVYLPSAPLPLEDSTYVGGSPRRHWHQH